MPSEDDERLGAACELVGRFLFHFSKVELELNLTIAKLFEMKEDSAEIIAANIDFNRKLYLLSSIVDLQAADKSPSWKESAETLISDIRAINNPPRQIVAHSSFEAGPQDNSVRFQRVVARETLKREEPVWTKETFDGYFSKMTSCERRLQILRGDLRAISAANFVVLLT